MFYVFKFIFSTSPNLNEKVQSSSIQQPPVQSYLFQSPPFQSSSIQSSQFQSSSIQSSPVKSCQVQSSPVQPSPAQSSSNELQSQNNKKSFLEYFSKIQPSHPGNIPFNINQFIHPNDTKYLDIINHKFGNQNDQKCIFHGYPIQTDMNRIQSFGENPLTKNESEIMKNKQFKPRINNQPIFNNLKTDFSSAQQPGDNSTRISEDFIIFSKSLQNMIDINNLLSSNQNNFQIFQNNILSETNLKQPTVLSDQNFSNLITQINSLATSLPKILIDQINTKEKIVKKLKLINQPGSSGSQKNDNFLFNLPEDLKKAILDNEKNIEIYKNIRSQQILLLKELYKIVKNQYERHLKNSE
ncbi:hypothetical protein DMUE_0075 [Dictyocoela muelleri]|nr:hypothetical protein DMUE_0075 [Dictyocoela muelleri]